jgi:hypothetical protein
MRRQTGQKEGRETKGRTDYRELQTCAISCMPRLFSFVLLTVEALSLCRPSMHVRLAACVRQRTSSQDPKEML